MNILGGMFALFESRALYDAFSATCFQGDVRRFSSMIYGGEIIEIK